MIQRNIDMTIIKGVLTSCPERQRNGYNFFYFLDEFHSAALSSVLVVNFFMTFWTFVPEL